MGGEQTGRTFYFLRNGNAEPEPLDWSTGVETARHAISEALNAKNIAVLLGAGCSSFLKDGDEVGISTMAPLANEFCREALAAEKSGFDHEKSSELSRDGQVGSAGTTKPMQAEANEKNGPNAASASANIPPAAKVAPWRLSKAEVKYLDALGINLELGYSRNLERLMEVLFAHRFVLRQSVKTDIQPARELIDSVIEKVQNFLWERVTAGAFASGDTTVRDLYERFYKKLVLRDRSLPRPWVFTTNYDHFNEMAMDRLGIHYANGFSGVVERRFNPASFRYALAEQLDVGSRKWTAVDSFVYLCKLHGSVTWTEDDHGLFPIRESWPPLRANRMMIYPTPAKQNSALGSPYSDLFREFQSRIVREQSVLMVAGYAFGDEHLNNIIYQALTIPTFRLVVFADPDTPGEIAKLRSLRDPRIWIIGGDGPAEGLFAHYFATVVEHFLPLRASERIDDAVRKVLSELAPKRDYEASGDEA